jgi:hypothetical protein
MDWTLQRTLSQKAGKVNQKGYENRTWEQEYDYHLGMVDNPLPFESFRLKFTRLNNMFEADPDGKNPHYDRPIMEICNQLGY